MKNRDALTDSLYHSLLIYLIFIYWFCIWSKLFRHRKATNRIIEFIEIFIDVLRNVIVLVKIKIVLVYFILEIHYSRTQYKLSIRHLKIWLYAIVQLFKYICDMRNLWIYLLFIIISIESWRFNLPQWPHLDSWTCIQFPTRPMWRLDCGQYCRC